VGWLLALGLAVGTGWVVARPGKGSVPEEGRFGFGRPADSAEIRRLDIDVRPDGRGLPPGEGTVARGRVVYAARCLACHGATGREGPYDVLVGRVPGDAFPFANDPRIPSTVGNYWPYATTVFDYVRRAMPFDAPGSLPVNDVYSVTALLLFWNNLVPEGIVLNRSSLPAVEMPARDRFVRDNRTGGPVVR